MFKKLKKLLLYGSLEKEEFHDIYHLIDKANSECINIYATIAIILFSLMTIAASFDFSDAGVNRTIYVACLCVSILVIVLSKYSVSQTVNLILVYVFQYMLYGFSLALMFRHPDTPSVSAMVLMVVIPLLFTYRPISIALTTTIVDVIFCVTVILVKDKDVIPSDIGNAIAYGLVAVFAGTFVCRLRIHNVMQNRKIELLSQTDLLTGLMNRNSYERNIDGYLERVNKNICCIYGDVNGLHEVNNNQGHEAGDRMLKTVAEEFKKQFGLADSYRIGGDEFVSFALDEKEADILDKIEYIEKRCEKYGYHVSIGHFNVPREELDITELIKTAEHEMYEKKFEYYKDHKVDRRKSGLESQV